MDARSAESLLGVAEHASATLRSAGARAALEILEERFSGLAAIAQKRGELKRAATLIGAAEAIMEAQHMAWPPDERPHYERLLDALPRSLGSAKFELARARGQSMTSGEAAAFALG